jgi:hypothetical protein
LVVPTLCAVVPPAPPDVAPEAFFPLAHEREAVDVAAPLKKVSVAPLSPAEATLMVTEFPAVRERFVICEYAPPPPPPPALVALTPSTPFPPAPIHSMVLLDELQFAGTVHDVPEVRKTVVVLVRLLPPNTEVTFNFIEMMGV